VSPQGAAEVRLCIIRGRISMLRSLEYRHRVLRPVPFEPDRVRPRGNRRGRRL